MSNPGLTLKAAAITHVGRVRDGNEDCIGINGWMHGRSMASPMTFALPVDRPTLCVVADGMGGHAGGEVASALAVGALMRSVQSIGSLQEVAGIVHEANASLFEAAAMSPQLGGMGATVVGAVLDGSSVCIFNVGDCRAYVSNGAGLELVSNDDTAAFRTTHPGGRTGTNGHAVIQCLGGGRGPTVISPHITVRNLASPTRIILCSDGLTDMLDLDAIEACLSKDAAETVRRLLDAALYEGGTDNISVVCLDLAVSAFSGATAGAHST